jgi:Ca2+-binding RTX toxin-like protein
MGGHGADRNDGGKGIDTVDYSASAAGVHLSLKDNWGSGGDADDDTFYFIENIKGSAYDDSIVGDKFANAIYGRNGGDVIEGGAGGDTLDGGEGIDTVSYAGSAVGVKVNLLTGIAGNGDATGDKVSKFENLKGSANGDVLIGAKGDNTIHGGKGDDEIDGGEGADRIVGEDGNDTMTGGIGADAFVFYVPPADVAAFIGFAPGHDEITDFDTSKDHLEFLFADSLSELSFTQSGADTIIKYANFDGSITLKDVDLTELMQTQSAILLV